MKKVFLMVLGGAMMLASCSTAKKTVALSDIEGEWNIVEVEGNTLKAADGKQLPFIGFDTKGNKVYGNSGCNSIHCVLSPKVESGEIDFSQMASTMMACPDMATETAVLKALGQAKTIATTEGGINLNDDKGNVVAVLQKRFSTMSFTELEGEWTIESVFNWSLPSELEEKPYIAFDTNEKRIGGLAGCNNMMGTVEVAENGEISMSNVATTRMACPDMSMETNVINAIKEVKKFGRIDENRVAFYSKAGTQIMVVSKRK